MKKILSKLSEFAGNLGRENTAESSKRSLALYATLVLGTYVTVVFTNEKNMEFVLGEILTFSLTLLGVTAWEKTTINKTNKVHKTKTDESSELS